MPENKYDYNQDPLNIFNMDPLDRILLNTELEKRYGEREQPKIGQAPGEVEDFLARIEAQGRLTKKDPRTFTETEGQIASEIPLTLLESIDLPGTLIEKYVKDKGGSEEAAMLADMMLGGMGPSDAALMFGKRSKAFKDIGIEGLTESSEKAMRESLEDLSKKKTIPFAWDEPTYDIKKELSRERITDPSFELQRGPGVLPSEEQISTALNSAERIERNIGPGPMRDAITRRQTLRGGKEPKPLTVTGAASPDQPVAAGTTGQYDPQSRSVWFDLERKRSVKRKGADVPASIDPDLEDTSVHELVHDTWPALNVADRTRLSELARSQATLHPRLKNYSGQSQARLGNELYAITASEILTPGAKIHSNLETVNEMIRIMGIKEADADAIWARWKAARME